MDQKTLKQLEKFLNNTLVNVATKDDLKNLATNETLASIAKRVTNMETNMATKADLSDLKSRIMQRLKDLEIEITVRIDTFKADKEQLKALEAKVSLVEQKITA